MCFVCSERKHVFKHYCFFMLGERWRFELPSLRRRHLLGGGGLKLHELPCGLVLIIVGVNSVQQVCPRPIRSSHRVDDLPKQLHDRQVFFFGGQRVHELPRWDVPACDGCFQLRQLRRGDLLGFRRRNVVAVLLAVRAQYVLARGLWQLHQLHRWVLFELGRSGMRGGDVPVQIHL